MDAPTLIEAARAYLQQHADANMAAVYLFGSVARNRAGPTSDVDIGVLYIQAPTVSFAALPHDLQADLEAELRRPVQIVVLNRASADLIHRVLRDGVLIFEGNHDTRVGFEVRMRQIYLDMLPVRRQYRRAREIST